MKNKIIIVVLILLGLNHLSANVFTVNQEKAFLNIMLGTTLDLANNMYNKKNVDTLTEIELSTISRNDVSFLDRWAIRGYEKDIDDAGSYLVLISLGATSLFSLWDDPYTWDNIMVMGEILVVQTAINQWTKSLTLRNRPYVYDEGTDLELKTDKDSRFSFYSRHTSTAFAIAVYNHYYQHYTTNSWLMIALPYGTATLVGVSRILSGSHFPTDVLVGALAGSVSSYLICKSHNSRATRAVYIGYNTINFQVRF